MALRINTLILLLASILLIGCHKEVVGELKQDIRADNFSTTMEEEPPIGKVIGKLSATTNIGELRFSIISSEDYFSVDSITGELYVRDPSFFDFEKRTKATGMYEVRSLDGSIRLQRTIKVILLNGTDSYINANNISFSVPETVNKNTYLINIGGSTNKGELTYSIKTQNPEGAVRVSEESGMLWVLDPSLFNYSLRKEITGIITLSNGIIKKDISFTIKITDVKSVQERLDGGETPYQIYNSDIKLYDSLWGKLYKGGYLIYYSITGKEGVVAAKEDLPKSQWGCEGSYLGATYKYITSGDYNTSVIFNKCFGTLTAASRTVLYLKDGHDDWYLPSIDELNLIHEKLYLNGIGNLKLGDYWSSTELNSSYAYRQFFNLVKKNQSTTLKRLSFNVRPVRKFKD